MPEVLVVFQVLSITAMDNLMLQINLYQTKNFKCVIYFDGAFLAISSVEELDYGNIQEWRTISEMG